MPLNKMTQPKKIFVFDENKKLLKKQLHEKFSYERAMNVIP